MYKIILFLSGCFLVSIPCESQPAGRIVPSELYRTNEDPMDIAADDRGIVLFTRKSFIDAGKNIISSYSLKLLSFNGALIKEKTIYSEKNKASIDHPEEQIEYSHLEISGSDYVLIGHRKNIKKSITNFQITFFDKDFNVRIRSAIDNDYDVILHKVVADKADVYFSGMLYGPERNPVNKLFYPQQIIYKVSPDASLADPLFPADLILPDSLKDQYETKFQVHDFKIVDHRLLLLIKALDKKNVAKLILMSVNYDQKVLQWIGVIENGLSGKSYFPESCLAVREDTLALVYQDSGQHHAFFYDLDKKTKHKLLLKQEMMLTSACFLNSALLLAGEVPVNSEIKSSQKTFAQNLGKGKAFRNYFLKVPDQNTSSGLSFGTENGESVKKMILYKGQVFFLSYAFIDWPQKKYTKLYSYR